MRKHLPIRPKISKNPRLNIYDFWDERRQQYGKCYGFELDFYDGISGTRIRRTVRADYRTAQANYRELMEQFKEGQDSLPLLIQRADALTNEELFESFARANSEPSLRNRQVRSPLTIKRTRSAVTAFQSAFDYAVKVVDVTPAKIELFIKYRISQGRKPGGINADLRTLKALFSWALRKGTISDNPYMKVEMFPAERSAPRPLSTDELARLFQVCPQGSRWFPLIMVYLLTGARLSEILKPKMTWDDIDFEKEMMTLPFRKGAKSSRIPLNVILMEIFTDLKKNPFEKDHNNEPEDVLFPFPINASYVSHKIKAILNEAGIDATAHDLRDTFVSYLMNLGYTIADVSKLAGHSNIKVTEKYYFAQLEDRRNEMISNLGRYMGDQVTASKTETENSDKERFRVTNSDQFKPVNEENSKRSVRRRIKTSPLVARGGIEPPTHGFSVHCSTN